MNIIQPTGQIFGQSLKNIKFGDFELTQGFYHSSINTPLHSHKWAMLCLVLKGSYFDITESKQQQRRASTVFFHPPDEPHISDFTRMNVGIFQIEIKPQRLRQMECLVSAFRNPVTFEGGIELQLGTRIYREFKLMDESSPIAIEGLTLELLAAVARSYYSKKNYSKIPGWLLKAKDFLHANFTENFTLDEIAAEIDVHPKYLATEFRRRFRLTIGEYTRHLRVEYASHQLAKSDACLVEIALAAGFYSQSHFARTFKQLTGFTPAQYRKNLQ